MKNILITGGSGLVGSNFIKILSKNKGCKVFSLYNNHPTNFKYCENIQVDITNRKKTLNLGKLKPNVIIHCAALTNIAFCESNPKLAYSINVEGTQNVIALAKMNNSKLIYISTDAVFDGEKGNYNEKDTPNPTTVYGKTKLKGEECCLDNYKNNTIIVRTNVFGKNKFIKKLSFIESILNNLEKDVPYSAFIDAKFSPIHVINLLEIIMKLENKYAMGIYHVGGNDSLTKYEFAKLVAQIFNYDVNLIKKNTIETISKHIKYPKKITLCNTKLRKFLNYSTPSIKEMLLDFKKDLGKN